MLSKMKVSKALLIVLIIIFRPLLKSNAIEHDFVKQLLQMAAR